MGETYGPEPAPSEVFGPQLARYRQRMQWTTERLSEELASLGVTMHPSAVTKIERGTRRVTLDEAMALSAALNVPLVLFLLPLRDREVVEVAPKLKVNPWLALGWLLGEQPIRNREITFWNQESAPLRLDGQLRAAQRAVRRAGWHVRSARERGDEAATERAEAAYERAFRQLGQALGLVYDHGLMPPSMPEEWISEMELRGIQFRRYLADADEAEDES
jgi:transcriptional regulator with XRE-family HTH domain